VKKTNRLAGHELPNEGRLDMSGPTRNINGPGRTSCSCGEKSPKLLNTSQRKQWHRDHKDGIRRGGDGKVWQGVRGL
jgi:hypothetical protein